MSHYRHIFCLVLTLLFVALPAFGGDHNHLLKIDGRHIYIHGANLAWLDGGYGHDIGINPLHPNWKCKYDSEHLATYLADMKRMHLNVVRVWLLEDLQGLVFDEDGLVSGLDPTFERNFEDMLHVAEEQQMALYLCLANNFMKTCQHLSVRDIAGDPAGRNAYLKNAVRPLTKRCKGKPCIFAFDIMNEPEQDIAGPTGNYTSKGISWEIMRRFIQANANAIHGADKTRLVTCSSGWCGTKNVAQGKFNGLGLDFYDFHVYSDNGTLPPVSTLNVDKPVIVGEYGQNRKEVDYDLQANVARTLLRSAVQGGYAGTLIWRYDFPNVKKPYIHDLLIGQGSGEWRPVCHVLQSFGSGIIHNSVPMPATRLPLHTQRSYPADAVAFGKHHYKVIWERLSWDQAKLSCNRMGGHLAYIESAEEKAFLANLKGNGKVVWLGGQRVGPNKWQWINGKAIEPKPKEPPTGYDYVAFTVGSSLNARPLDGHAASFQVKDIQGYICEWE